MSTVYHYYKERRKARSLARKRARSNKRRRI